MEQEVVLDVKVKNQTLKQQLREAVKEAQALQERFGATSNEAIQAAKKVANLKEEISDMNDVFKAFHPEQKLNAVIGVAQGIAGGFQAVTGAMALFGVESKDVEKALLKVQAASAFAEGLNSVMGLGDAFKNLTTLIKSTEIGTKAAAVAQRIYNAVMAANPIGLLIAGLTALVGVIALVVNAMGDEDESQKTIIANREKEIDLLKSQNETYKKSAEFRKNLAAAQGASSLDLLNIEKEVGNERKKQIDKELSLLEQNIADRKKLLKNADEEERIELQKKNSEDYKQIKGLNDEKLQITRDYLINVTKINTENDKKEEERNKAAIEKAKENAKRLKELREKEAEDEYQFKLKRLEQERELDAKYQKEKIDQQVEDFNKAVKANKDRRDALLQSLKDQADIELMQNKDSLKAQRDVENADFQLRLDGLKTFYGKTKEEQDANKLSVEKLELEHKQKLKEIDDKAAADKIESQQKVMDATFQIAQQTLNGLVALAEIGIKNEKKLEQAKKTAALIQIGIDTAQAISGIVKMASTYSANPAMFAITLATGIATVLANIAKAKQILSSAGSSGAAPSLQTAAPPPSTTNNNNNAPQITQSPQQQSQNISNADMINNAFNNPNMVRAVVVETDITDSQRRIRGIEQRATFG